ncbi:phage virion morphogenesis protein [Klebsiella pneumoniae]|uniref:phage virion morphogenesis protein n=3 Tax=Klebsiella pneumoniae TaxID=573 RepID=UPI0012BACB06|nr:phage virion morphogenesis protein [Klebsiella pneumoniae]MTE58797.1 phage virion morphogenesis protein [Klebsiella pneumoniae]
MNDFKPFDDKLAGLIAALSPTARRKMAADIAKPLRARQQRRIKTQKAPDGTPYAARKRQPVKAKKDRVKREMFAKLRISRFMKATAGNDVAVVEFTGKVQRMVNVHQYGLKDKPRESANKQVMSSQADSLIKISRIWADFFPANTSNQPI